MKLYGCHTIDVGEQNEGDKKIDAGSCETLINDILTEIPTRLAALYSEAKGKSRTEGRLNDYSFSCRLRKELAIQYEEFCESTIAGFSNNLYMPHCRCFDLREETLTPESEDELMVLLVDIHT